MRTLLSFVLSVCAIAANLRQVDVLQPLEISLQVFGQAFDTVAQGLELQLLSLLYPDNAADIQAQLDTCEASFWSAQVADLQAINGDFLGLASACNDPSTATNQLIQDVVTLVFSIVPSCPDLSVDLQGDINNLIASAISQGFQFSAAWTGPLAQWTAAAASPFVPQYETFQPGTDLIESVLRTLGSTDEQLAESSSFARPLVAGLSTAVNDVAGTGSLPPSDIASLLGNAEGLLSSNAQGFAQIFQNLAQSTVPLAQALCAVVGPLPSALPSTS